MADRPTGRFSPWVVAEWLEGLSADAGKQATRMETSVADSASPAVRRLIVDLLLMQAGIGRFFAAKLRAAVLYEISAEHVERSNARQGSPVLSRSAVGVAVRR